MIVNLNFHWNKLNNLFAIYFLIEPLKIIKKPKIRQYLRIFMQANKQKFKPRQISRQHSFFSNVINSLVRN